MKTPPTLDPGGDTYYVILSIPETATQDEIKRAYRRLIRQIHPDKFPNCPPHWKSAAEKKSREVIEAYYVLSDAAQRSSYDQQLARHRQQLAPAPPPQQQRAATTSPPRFYTPPPSPRPQPRAGHPEPQDMSQEHPIAGTLLFSGTLLIAAAILFTLFIDILIFLIELLQPL